MIQKMPQPNEALSQEFHDTIQLVTLLRTNFQNDMNRIEQGECNREDVEVNTVQQVCDIAHKIAVAAAADNQEELECYADRILDITEDATKRQALRAQSLTTRLKLSDLRTDADDSQSSAASGSGKQFPSPDINLEQPIPNQLPPPPTQLAEAQPSSSPYQ